MLAREIKRIKGEIPRKDLKSDDWAKKIPVDLFLYNDADEEKKNEKKNEKKEESTDVLEPIQEYEMNVWNSVNISNNKFTNSTKINNSKKKKQDIYTEVYMEF